MDTIDDTDKGLIITVIVLVVLKKTMEKVIKMKISDNPTYKAIVEGL